jgi:glycosyltransferase involved in cell wall biosynthesis
MHVGLNCLFLVPGETGGMEVAARELIRALRLVAPDLELTAFVNREGSAEGFGTSDNLRDARVRVVALPVSARRRTQWVLGEQLLLPRAARRAGIDVLHSLGGTGPARAGVPHVMTVHDVHFRSAPQAHFGWRGAGLALLVPRAARRAARVIVPSAATRGEVVRHLGLPPTKVALVEPGAGRSPVAATDDVTLRRRLDLGDRRVLLSLAAKRPHKNLGSLLAALAMFAPQDRPVAVLAGYTTPLDRELRARAAALGVEDGVRMVGWLPDADIEGLFGLSAALVHVAHAEGFGLPVIEAMARGVPVICSDRPPLTTISDGSAWLVDPGEPAEITAAIRKVLAGGAEVSAKTSRGRDLAASRSWETTARATLAIYHQVAVGSLRM